MEPELNNYLKRLGKNISMIRNKKKMSQYKLAQEILTDQSNLARIEQGEVNTTIKTLLKISVALECDVKDLVSFRKE
jgi:DNA-binding Xre family transcriptional regulator